jgi:hypothetical protein
MPRGTYIRISDEQRASIVLDYRAGLPHKVISAKYGIADINHTLQAAGEPQTRRPLMPPSHQLTTQDKADMVERYLTGETIASLAKHFGVQYQSIRNNLLRRKVQFREPWADIQRLPCDHAFFDELTPTTKYWAGFIMADGCVFKNTISLGAAERDADHIRTFVQHIGYGGSISTRPNSPSPNTGAPTSPITRVCFHSKQMVAALGRIGIVARKSLTAEVIDNTLLLDRDFWRGVIDGDGTVGWHPGTDRGYAYPYLQLCSGSTVLLNQFRDFIRSYFPHCDTKIHKSKTIWFYRLAGTPAARIAAILYDAAAVALPRKKATADTFHSFAERRVDLRFSDGSLITAVLADYYERKLQWKEIAKGNGITIPRIWSILNKYGHGVNRASA